MLAAVVKLRFAVNCYCKMVLEVLKYEYNLCDISDQLGGAFWLVALDGFLAVRVVIFVFCYALVHNLITFLFLLGPYRKWQKNNPNLAQYRSYFGFARGVGEFWFPERNINRLRALLSQLTSFAVITTVMYIIFIVWSE